MERLEGLMTVSDAAAYCGCKKRTLQQAAKRGAIRYMQVGNMFLLVEEDVRAYHERTRSRPGRPLGSRDVKPRSRPRTQQAEETAP